MTPFYVAQAKGIYQAENLEVSSSGRALKKEPIESNYTDESFRGMAKENLFPKQWGAL